MSHLRKRCVVRAQLCVKGGVPTAPPVGYKEIAIVWMRNTLKNDCTKLRIQPTAQLQVDCQSLARHQDAEELEFVVEENVLHPVAGSTEK